MLFKKVHAVGNRQRWRTTQTISVASMALVASEIEEIDGVTGLMANPRTGSVTVTVANISAIYELDKYFEWLKTHPPITRHNSEKAKRALAQTKTEIAQAKKHPAIVRTLANTSSHLVRGMPLMRLVRQIPRLFAKKVTELDTAEPILDLSPLARYVFVRPFLPIMVNSVNAILGSLPIIFEGLKSLLQGKLNVSVLDAAALSVSLFRRDFKTAGLLIVLLGLGEMLESYTRKKSLSSLTEQLAINVNSVWIRTTDGEIRQKSLKELQVGEEVVVHAGSVIPIDGIVSGGEGSVNQSSMTGEPLPVHRYPGASVFAGTVLEDGELTIRATHIGGETRLNQIARFIEESEVAKASIQGKAERWADRIVPFNFLLAALVYFFTKDFNRMASVLMVDFSCALRLATPLAILTAMRVGTREGAVIKGGRYLEALSEVDTVVFDKTGTLTASSPKLSDVIVLDGKYSREELLRLAACLEEHFPHPVGRAIVRQAAKEDLWHDREDAHAEVRYIVAHGICSAVGDRRIVLGSRHFIEDDEQIDVSAAQEIWARLANEGKSILYLAVGNKLVGVLGIEDPIRPESKAVIEELHALGIKRILMLTGDDKRTAQAVAARLGIDEFHAGILPADKARIVEALKAQGAKVLMIGDGINDTPALSASDVGVTLRDGADIAQEVADVVLTHNNLSQLPQTIMLGRATMSRIRQNFITSVGLNGAFLTGGLTGRLTPTAGALLHNGTTIGVCLNAMRDSAPMNKRAGAGEISDSIRNAIRYVTQIANIRQGNHHGQQH